MPVQMELNKHARSGHKPVKIFTRDIEASALAQLKNIAGLPIVHSHVAAMPDVHAGIGATVGSRKFPPHIRISMRLWKTRETWWRWCIH